MFDLRLALFELLLEVAPNGCGMRLLSALQRSGPVRHLLDLRLGVSASLHRFERGYQPGILRYIHFPSADALLGSRSALSVARGAVVGLCGQRVQELAQLVLGLATFSLLRELLHGLFLLLLEVAPNVCDMRLLSALQRSGPVRHFLDLRLGVSASLHLFERGYQPGILRYIHFPSADALPGSRSALSVARGAVVGLCGQRVQELAQLVLGLATFSLLRELLHGLFLLLLEVAPNVCDMRLLSALQRSGPVRHFLDLRLGVSASLHLFERGYQPGILRYIHFPSADALLGSRSALSVAQGAVVGLCGQRVQELAQLVLGLATFSLLRELLHGLFRRLRLLGLFLLGLRKPQLPQRLSTLPHDGNPSLHVRAGVARGGLAGPFLELLLVEPLGVHRVALDFFEVHLARNAESPYRLLEVRNRLACFPLGGGNLGRWRLGLWNAGCGVGGLGRRSVLRRTRRTLRLSTLFFYQRVYGWLVFVEEVKQV